MQDEPRRRGPLFYTGALALAVAMCTDAVAVIGRHLGTPLLGAIEVMEAAILVAAAAAIVSATLAGTHATVRLVTDRLAPGPRTALMRSNALLSALFFIALATGSIWIAVDLWSAHEESEVLRLPYRPLRIVAILAVAGIAWLYLREALTGRRPDPPQSEPGPR